MRRSTVGSQEPFTWERGNLSGKVWVEESRRTTFQLQQILLPILCHQMVVLCLVSVFNCCRGVSSYSRFYVPYGQGWFRYRFHFFQSTSHCVCLCWHPQPQVIDGHPSLCHSGLASSFRSESLLFLPADKRIFKAAHWALSMCLGGGDPPTAYFIAQSHFLVKGGWDVPRVGDQGVYELSCHFRVHSLFS